jgi:hypothetical protein
VVSRVLGHSYDALTTPERLNLLERLERETRRPRTPGQELINQRAEQAGPDGLGGRLPQVLADRLRVTRREAHRRVAEAAELGPPRALCFQSFTHNHTETTTRKVQLLRNVVATPSHRTSPMAFEFCSGLVDLVVCVRHHGGGGHCFALVGERFVNLVAEHIAEVGDCGGDFGVRRRG